MEEWLMVGLRTLGLFILLLIVIPILGRKSISSMTLFDYIIGWVAAVMIGLIALNVVNNIANGLLGISLWVLLIAGLQFLVLKSKWIHDHVYGKQLIVIKEGKIMEENLEVARLTHEELLSQLRRKNIFQISDVEFAVMESNGDINILLKRDRQPLTPKDMRIQVNTTREPQTVILDGNIVDESLGSIGLSRQWLQTELEKIGVTTENVFIAQVDSMGELFVDLFDDSLQLPKSSNKDLLLANLKGIEADFMSYAVETQDEEWKNRFNQYAHNIREVVNQLEPHLTT